MNDLFSASPFYNPESEDENDMAKFCRKCGTKLDQTTGLCPKCEGKKKHTGRRVIAIILVLALIAGGAWFAGWKLGLLPFGNKDGAPPATESFALLTDSFTERKITDQASALAAIGDVADTLGIEDVSAEFSECKVDTVSGNTYYRFYQEYKGIPVYGRSMIVVADDNGDSLSLSGNYLAVREMDTAASLTQQEVDQAIHKYFSKQFNISEFDSFYAEEISNNALCIYNMGGLNCLSYKLHVVSSQAGCYEVIVNAQKPEVICAKSMIRYDYEYDESGQMETISAKGQKEDKNLDVYNQDGVYYMADTNRNIELYKLENEKKYYWSWVNIFEYNLVFSGNAFDVFWDNTKQPAEYSIEVDALANIQVAYDYYLQRLTHKSTDGQGKSTIFLFTNSAIVDEKDGRDWTDNAASGSNVTNNVTAIYVGRTKDNEYALSADLDIMAHEYTHGVVAFACGLGGNDEADAINEGISDVFGELVEEWEKGCREKQHCDWIHGSRTIYDPSVNGYAETVSDTNNGGEDFAHGHSTVISHAAYLMYTGIGGSRYFEALTAEDLAHLFYATLNTLPSDCTFSQFRTLVQNQADIMWKQGRLSYDQTRCVSYAFSQVGIYPAVTLVSKDKLSLDVYGTDGEPYENYTLYVRHYGGTEKKYSGETAIKGISFPTTGGYELTIEDNANTDNRTTFSVRAVDNGGATRIPVFTQCGTSKIEGPIIAPPTENTSTSERLLTRVNHYYKNGDSTQYEFAYDEQNRLSALNVDTSGETKYTYNRDGKLIWAVHGEPIDEYRPGENSGAGYEYNSKGQLIKEFYWEGGYYKVCHEYDGDGKRIRSIRESDPGTSTYEHVYDENGVLVYSNILRQSSWNEETQEYTTQYDYTYKPFVIESNDGYMTKAVKLCNTDGISLIEFNVYNPQYYVDTEGYLTKIVDEDGSIYEFHYDIETGDDNKKPSQEDENTGASSALKKYMEAADKTTATGSWTEDMTMEGQMLLKNGNSTVNAKVYMDSSIYITGWNGSDTSSLYMSGWANMSVLDQEIAYTMTWKNGLAHYAYTKPSVTETDMVVDPSFFNIHSLTKEMILSSSISGNQIEITVKGDELTKIGVATAGEMLQGVTKLSYSDADVRVSVNSDTGAIDTISMTFSVSMTIQGYDASAEYTIEYQFSNYGNSASIIPGADGGNADRRSIWLDELQIVDSDRYTGNMGDSFVGKIGTRNDVVDTEGNVYEHGLEAWIARWNYQDESSWAWSTYDLGGKYSTLSGTVGLLESCYNKTDFNTTLEIWGDDALLYSLNLLPDMENKEISLDVTGVKSLKISI